MNNPLKTGNLIFFPIDSNNTFINRTTAVKKYMAGVLYGELFPSEIYTFEEIKFIYPDIKEIKLTCESL